MKAGPRLLSVIELKVSALFNGRGINGKGEHTAHSLLAWTGASRLSA